MYREEDRCIQGLVGKHKENRPLAQPGVYGKIIFKWIFRTWGHGLD